MKERCYTLKSMNTSSGQKIEKTLRNRKRNKAFSRKRVTAIAMTWKIEERIIINKVK